MNSSDIQSTIDLMRVQIKKQQEKYNHAMRNGVEFDELKKIFLELKERESKLKSHQQELEESKRPV